MSFHSAASASTTTPRSPRSSAVDEPPSRGSSRRSPTTTYAPSSAKRSAIARPSPEAPPVTTATRSASLPLTTGLPYAGADPGRRRPPHASARRPPHGGRGGAPRRHDNALRLHRAPPR